MIKRFDKKENLGITLIALVITIVVLIILATVVINLSLEQNGLFNKAKYATQSYKNAQDYEDEQIEISANSVEQYAALARAGETSSYSIVKLGEETGNKVVSFDATKYDEIYVEMLETNDNRYCEFNIKTITLTATTRRFMGTATWANAGNWFALSISSSGAQISEVRRDGSNVTSSAKIFVYGVKY